MPSRGYPAASANGSAAGASEQLATPHNMSKRNGRRRRVPSKKTTAAHAVREAAPPADSDNEKDWRWAEVCGASSAVDTPVVETKRGPLRTGLVRRHGSNLEDGWRWAEVSGGQPVEPEPQWAGSSTSGGSTPVTPASPASLACDPVVPADPAVPLASPGELLAQVCIGDETDKAPLAVALVSQPNSGPVQPQLGDIVTLGPRALAEHRQRPAVVTRVDEAHCTVVVLDEDRRAGRDECWPCFEDIKLVDQSLRLGNCVVISGMQGVKTAKLNGQSGKIVRHPREGHPTFVVKKASPDPQMTVTVKLDTPAVGGPKSVLVEPRFLVPYEAFVESMASSLENTLSALSSAH